jgi:hypothetical protein
VSKYGKEDVYVTASDGKRVLREMLSEYERKLSEIRNNPSNPPKKSERLQSNLEKEMNMEPDKDNVEVSKINDDATVINYIMLARIYDMLTIIGDALGRGEDVLKLINLHKQGQLMSPPPIIAGDDNEEA